MHLSRISNQGIELGTGLTKAVCKTGSLNPAQLRLFLGATALATKPVIDYQSNKNLDPETRKYSVIKVITKTVVGTLTGATVRQMGISLGKKLIEKGVFKSPYKTASMLKRYNNGLANTLAFLATLASITFIDIPFMNKVMDRLSTKKNDGGMVG